MGSTAVPHFRERNGMSHNWIGTNSERSHRLDEQERSSPVTWHARAVKGLARTASPRFLRAFTFAFGVIAGAAAPSLAIATGQTPAEFISTIGNDALAEMRSVASLDQKLAYFRQMLIQDFDLEGISRFVLGPYWRTASPEQQQEFQAVLETQIIRSDGRKLAESSGGDFRVTGSRTDPNAVILVTGEIITPQGAPNEMDFQLGIVDGLYRSRTSPSIMSAWH
jgi:phospholipid transport system substrate-binding protein